MMTTVRSTLRAGAPVSALAACAGPPVDSSALPLGEDGKSRWLLVQVPEENPGFGDFFVRGIYARPAGAPGRGDNITLMSNIHPCRKRAFDVDDGTTNCRFDVRAEMYGCRRPVDDDATWWNLIVEDVDLCAMNETRQVFLPPGPQTP